MVKTCARKSVVTKSMYKIFQNKTIYSLFRERGFACFLLDMMSNSCPLSAYLAWTTGQWSVCALLAAAATR